MVVGDCLGSAVDGTGQAVIDHRFPRDADFISLRPSRYGAATEMTVALARSLVLEPDFDGETFAQCLVDEQTKERGYGTSTRQALDRLRAGDDWTTAATVGEGRESFGNGAAVRVAPAGLLFSRDQAMLRWAAEESASLTHHHALAVEGAAIQAFAVASALASRGQPLEAGDFLAAVGAWSSSREFRTRFEQSMRLAERDAPPKHVIERIGNNATALGSVVTASYCFATNADSAAAAISAALRLGGNTAATAPMVGALTGARLGLKSLPTEVLGKLGESEALDPDHLRTLGASLFEKNSRA